MSCGGLCGMCLRKCSKVVVENVSKMPPDENNGVLNGTSEEKQQITLSDENERTTDVFVVKKNFRGELIARRKK